LKGERVREREKGKQFFMLQNFLSSLSEKIVVGMKRAMREKSGGDEREK
jgi:hypothetical protein